MARAYTNEILLCGLVVIICTILANGAVCPPPEYMSPCTCQTNCTDCPAEMKCHDLHNPTDISNILAKTKNFSFRDLIIENSVLLYLPASSIEERGFNQLTVRDSSMGSVFDRAPSTDTLYQVWIQNTRFRSGIQWKQFANLTSLTGLAVSQSEIRRLSKNFGEVSPSLKYLWLMDTKTGGIENGALEKLVNLETLYVTKSNIRELDRSILPRPSNIKAFMILESRIQTLPEDMFNEMPEIKSIVLSGNRITRFDSAVFGGVLNQLTMFSLDNNPIRCDCDTKWVTDVTKFPNFFSGKCGEPKELQGKRLNLLKPTDFRQC